MSPTPPEEGFLSRWSRRKAQQQVPTEAAVAVPAPSRVEAPPAAAVPAPARVEAPPAVPHTEAAPTAKPVEARAQTPPPPTLDDVEKLDAQSDYRTFVTREVDPEVRNAALKKLFHSDPHFNVMDGLDVYIDDYNTPNPLPVAIMKTLVQARALGLIDDELKEQDLPPPDRPTVAGTDADAVTETETEAGTSSETATDQDSPAPTPSPPITSNPPPEPLLSRAVDGAVEPAGLDRPFPSTAPASAATAPGNVVPFPRRPDPAGPT